MPLVVQSMDMSRVPKKPFINVFELVLVAQPACLPPSQWRSSSLRPRLAPALVEPRVLTGILGRLLLLHLH